ncbi:endoplasmic reticulum aminopeptidase 2-like [Pseudomyrmex gracilis]|uniref:endoplasmic reticulum aminopeptidase 2-like n=1 Tax=Pseudomyrmex gracilis TaxID=219809 RepID=UPI000994E2B3|nr:endoplasmic reticulum aminopeptidase 2-like [Pseudomyrmex gracilis]
MCKERVIMPFLLLSLSNSLIFSAKINTDYILGTYNITPLYYELILMPEIEEGFFREIQFYSRFTENTTIDGFLRTSCTDLSGNKQWMIVTRTQMSGPQTIFPCWNNPRFKTVFSVSIRHPKNYMAFSNSKIRNSTFDGDMMWTHFESTPSISPHCIAIVAMPEHTPYRDQYDHDHVMLWSLLDNFAHRTQLNLTWNIIWKVKTYLEQLNILDQCKVTDTNYIATTDFSENDVIATHAFVIYREQHILFTENISSVQDKLNVISFIVQQMTYQWILRSISSLSWSSSWLHGATNFFSTYILRKIVPQLEWINSSILMKYEEIYSTSFHFNVEDVVEFIISLRSTDDFRNVRKEKTITSLDFLKSKIENIINQYKFLNV